MSDNRIVNWNVSKKEQRDKELAEKKVKAIVGRTYQLWKDALLKRTARCTLSEHTAQLRASVLNVLSEHPDLDAYMNFTEGLLNEVCERVRRAEVLGSLNSEDERRAASTVLLKRRPNVFNSPKGIATPFHSEEELLAVPEVQEATRAEDFGGLVMQERNLMMVHVGSNSSLSFTKLGVVDTQKGISKFPTVEEFLKASGKLDPDSSSGDARHT